MSTRALINSSQHLPRLLTAKQAAAYCAVSIGVFRTHCPVRPISLGRDERLLRYDRIALDRWIENFGTSNLAGQRDWLAALDKET